MRREKEFFSLIMAGLLFIGAGLVFAAEDSSGGKRSGVEGARDDLSKKLRAQPGILGCSGVDFVTVKGEEILVVYVGSEQVKGEVPTSFEGFRVVTLLKPNNSLLLGASLDEIEEELSRWSQTGQSTGTGQVNPLVGSIGPSSISFKTSYVGTLDNNKILPNIQNIEINSRIAEFSTPPIPKMTEFPTITQPQSYNTGILTDEVWPLGTIPRLSLQQEINPKIGEFFMPVGTPPIQPGSDNRGMLANDGGFWEQFPSFSLLQLLVAPTTK